MGDTDFDRQHVTIAAVPHGPEQLDVIEQRIRRAVGAHQDPVDALVVIVPAGFWDGAREKIWTALGTAPVEQSSELATASYYEGNLMRMMEADAYRGGDQT